MDQIRNRVAEIMNEDSKPVAVNYKAKVTAKDGLNCRNYHGTSGAILTSFPYNTVLTITQEVDGWGYANNTGWVSLAYTAKVNTMEEDDDEMTYEDFKKYIHQYRAELQDNDAEPWSQADRDWAVSIGLMKGSGKAADGSPNMMWDDFLTRQQAAALFHRLAQYLGKA